MSRRNVKKTISESSGIYSQYYDLTVRELLEIIDMSHDMVDAVGYGFQFGYVLGSRAERKRQKSLSGREAVVK